MPKDKVSTSKMSLEEMTRKLDTTKNPITDRAVVERKHAYKPYDKMLSDFMTAYQNKLGNIKSNYKQLTAHIRANQIEINEKNEQILVLKKQITEKNKESAEMLKARDKLKSEHIPLKLELSQFKAKYSGLEISYSKNMHTVHSENEQLRLNIEQYNLNHTKVTEQFEANRKEWQDKLTEAAQKLAAQEETILELQRGFEESKEDLKNERSKLQNIENNISGLKAELLEKDAIIVKSNENFKEMERTKNIIIEQQAFKIHEIERVFRQTTTVVAPQPNRAASPHFVAPLPQTAQTASTSNAPLRRASRLNTAEQPSSSGKLLQRAPPRRLSSAENEFSSQSDDEGVEGWHFSALNSSRFSESRETIQQPIGFRRRAFNEANVYVAETSESTPFSTLSKN